MEIIANKQGIRETEKTQSWRMVYNDTKVLHLFESSGVTKTIQKLFVAETEEECLTEAKRLGLELPKKKEN